MSTDFGYGNKTINTTGPMKPSGINQPLDPRTEVKLYADIKLIPNPYVGMIITVLEDETNSNKMTDYKVLSLKADDLGVANSVVDRVQRYVEYLGVSGSGGTGIDGQDGATFTPSVASDGTLSWTNDKSLPNPTPVNIKGDKGDTGATGANGQDGATPTLKIGTTTTLSAGSSATVSITKSPTTEEYTIDFGIPKGADGAGGSGSSADLTNYQKKTDNTLTTTNKTITGAINEVKNELDGKVNKIDGKGLSTNDYTNEEKTTLANLNTTVGDKSGLPSGDANIIASINRIDSKTSTGGTGLTSEQAQQLAIAYEHSQVSHVSLDEVDAKITEATSNVTMLNQNGGTQLLIWAGTQQEYDELLVYDNNTVYLIEGGSSVIVTRYTITNNLTNVSTSNSANSIAEGSSYEAKLSVSTGYNIGNVSITMGGVDITSTCYNNKTITISSVTGNIVITAEAVESSGTTDIDSKYTLAYSLDEETVFTGSNNIETNVALFDSDKDFTIFADFTPSTNSVGTGSQNVLFRVKQSSSPWIGVDIAMWNEGSKIGNRGTIITNGTKKGIILGKMCTGISNDTTNRLKFVIKRVASDKKLYFYDSQGLLGSYSDAGDVATNTFNDTVKIGGQRNSGTTFMACTTHAFKIFFDNVSEEDITTLLQ